MVSVVDASIKNGIYVIIDWHIEGTNANNQASALSFFAEMAQKYKDNNNVFYEGWNEPTGDSWSGVIKPYHTVVLKAIRAHTDNLYIAGSPSWSQKADEAC